jgi:hypothetical protein
MKNWFVIAGPGAFPVRLAVPVILDPAHGSTQVDGAWQVAVFLRSSGDFLHSVLHFLVTSLCSAQYFIEKYSGNGQGA